MPKSSGSSSRLHHQEPHANEKSFVDLDEVVALGILVIPDISGGEARASLQQLSLA
jgi:hypothetical protein